MRVFVTGAAGFIGSATTRQLVAHGHTVVGLARSDASAAKIRELGGEVHKGSLTDADSLREGAASADAVIHLAFDHDFSNKTMADICVTDRAAISAMAEGIKGSGKPFIIASGTLGLRDAGKTVTEHDMPDPNDSFGDRQKSSDMIYEMSKDGGVKGIVLRFAPTVHGKGDHGFVPFLINAARKNGKAILVGDGNTRWPAVHVEDAAVLVRLALEKGKGGATYHPIAEEGVPMKSIMGLAAEELKVPVESVDPQKALELLSFLGFLVGADNPTSSEWTKKELGWEPKQVGLLEDMKAHYFGEPVKSMLD